MSTVQVSDGASSVTATSTVNDGGVVVNGGAIASNGPMTVNKSLTDMADGGTDYGSKVVAQDGTSGDYAGVSVAASGSAGGLAFYPNAQEGERNFLIVGAGTAGGNNEINNTASSILTSPASEVGLRNVSPMHLTVSTRQHGANSDAEYNLLARPSTAMVPNRTKGTGAGSAATYVNPVDGSSAVDSEIRPSRAVPGELTYMAGSTTPVTDEYKAKDSRES
jgi:hypothetical protein